MKINSFLAIGIAIAFTTSSCRHSENKRTRSDAAYHASTVISTKVANQLLLPGELEGYYETGINAKVNGYISHILVDIGDNVKQGQLLVQLEAPELVSQLETSHSEVQGKEALFLNSKGKYRRLQQAARTPGAVSAFDLDLAKTSVISDSLSAVASKSKYQSVKSLTDYLHIVAPFDGIITERALAPGAFVGPNDNGTAPILKLKNQVKLRLHVPVPEKYLAEVRVGNTVQFSVESFPDKLYEGRITRTAKNVASKTRSELIEVEIANNSGELLPGMYAHAIIPIRRSGSSLVVPANSVVTNMERSFVIKVINNNTAQWIDVQKGQSQGQMLEIFGALKAGDTIVNDASDEIRDHQPIKVIVTKKGT